jgi:hypothetical protein
MIIVSLYLTLLVIITQDYNWQSVPYAKWLFPFCNLKFRRDKEFSHEVIFDMMLHSILVLAHLHSIGLIKIVVTIY